MKLGKIEVTSLNVATATSIGVGALAFSLSFTALTDLAQQNGIGSGQAWMLPLVVDGLVVVSTAASAKLKRFAAAYAWSLLVIGTAISVWGNVTHAQTNGFGVVGMAIAAVPPMVLLAVSHLTILLARQAKREDVVDLATTSEKVEAEEIAEAPVVEEPAIKTILVEPTNAPVIVPAREALHTVG